MWYANRGGGEGMIRRLFTFASVLSSLLCVVLALAAVRAQSASDSIDYGHGRWRVTAIVIDRSLLLAFFHLSEPVQGRGWTWSRNRADPGYTIRYNPTIWGAAGFYSHRRDGVDAGGVSTTRIIGVPLWLLCLLTAAPPFALAVSSRRRRIRTARRKANLCLACGYDLRASTDRCPECGTPIPVRGVA